ncbi:uncharacterized protein [Aegilops tauschii subsp. strangulata]|uniref:uncharacterized protein isoform X2 n=1 Tax=Aegilops tauschii subsp. strangulata TaxID=200361 RepID=UPI001E1CA3D7|nr:proline-rich receptor-like protein kinase PERK2 isoform X2 [Aegilops tauschii subsp. strangulata]XP_045089749.1 proline-rich receptor-like protein kinase PERK2 isoform X2 [Aegilops tauschii subsp. strangulata]
MQIPLVPLVAATHPSEPRRHPPPPPPSLSPRLPRPRPTSPPCRGWVVAACCSCGLSLRGPTPMIRSNPLPRSHLPAETSSQPAPPPASRSNPAATSSGRRALCFVVPHPSSRSWPPLLHRPPPSLPARSDGPVHLLPAEDDEGEDAKVVEGGGGGGMRPVAIRWPCITCALKNKREDMVSRSGWRHRPVPWRRLYPAHFPSPGHHVPCCCDSAPPPAVADRWDPRYVEAGSAKAHLTDADVDHGVPALQGHFFCHGRGVRHHDFEPHNLQIAGWQRTRASWPTKAHGAR